MKPASRHLASFHKWGLVHSICGNSCVRINHESTGQRTVGTLAPTMGAGLWQRYSYTCQATHCTNSAFNAACSHPPCAQQRPASWSDRGVQHTPWHHLCGQVMAPCCVTGWLSMRHQTFLRVRTAGSVDATQKAVPLLAKPLGVPAAVLLSCEVPA
jgi:hypothetical protein